MSDRFFFLSAELNVDSFSDAMKCYTLSELKFPMITSFLLFSLSLILALLN